MDIGLQLLLLFNKQYIDLSVNEWQSSLRSVLVSGNVSIDFPSSRSVVLVEVRTIK